MKVKASKKLLAIVFAVSAVAVIVLAALSVVDCVKYSRYIQAEALVSSVYTDSSLTNASGKSSVEKYAVCNYSIDGESFSQKYRLGMFHSVGEDDVIKIRVNPDNHSEIADTYALKTKIICALFFLMFGVVTAVAIGRVSKSEHKKSF